MSTTTSYRDKLTTERNRAATTLARITTRAVLENCITETAPDRALLRHQVDTLTTQLDWMARHTAWVSPHAPAWTD